MNIPWLDEIKKHVGDSESNHLKEIIGFIEEVDPSIDYRVAWCAATVGHFLKHAGYPGSGSLAAVSYLKWGEELDEAIPGCVVIFQWASGDHHVTFMDDDQNGADDNHIACVGGNQSHMIKRSIYTLDNVMDGGFRWPKGVDRGQDV